MSIKKCQAKDPSKCRYHGNSGGSGLMAKVMDAVRNRSFADYAKNRAEMENAAVVAAAPQPETEAPKELDEAVAAAEAIRKAEAEAVSFYQAIEDEERERTRLEDMYKVCTLMWKVRENEGAPSVVSEYLEKNTKDFSETERATIVRLTSHLHPDHEDNMESTKAFRFISSIAQLNRAMRNGYYFDNTPVTELLARHEPK